MKTISLLAISIPILVFAPSIAGSFNLDDIAQVKENPVVREFDIGAILTKGYWEGAVGGSGLFLQSADLYRPLTTFSIAISHQLWGESPWGYHLENVLLHAIASWLVLGLLLRWGFSTSAALTGSLLFGIAPVHIEAVAGIVQRGELLAAIFGLLFLRAMTRRKAVLAGIWLLAALLCKESAIGLVLVAVVAGWVTGGLEKVRPGLLRLVPALLACALYLVIRQLVLGHLALGDDPRGLYFEDAEWPIAAWLTSARFAVEHYLPAMLFGAPLIFDYSHESYPTASTGDAWAWCCAGFWIALLLTTAHFAFRRRSLWALGPLLFLVSISPVMNIATRISILGATRLLYFPYLGIAMSLALLGGFLWRRFSSQRRLLAGCAVAVLLAYSTWTEVRLQAWSTPLSLYQDIVARVPRNTLALGFLAQEEIRLAQEASHPLRCQELFESARNHLCTAIEVRRSEWPRYIQSLTRVSLELGHLRELLTLIDGILRSPPYSLNPTRDLDRIIGPNEYLMFLYYLRRLLPDYIIMMETFQGLQAVNRAAEDHAFSKAERRRAFALVDSLESTAKRLLEELARIKAIRDESFRRKLDTSFADPMRVDAVEKLQLVKRFREQKPEQGR